MTTTEETIQQLETSIAAARTRLEAGTAEYDRLATRRADLQARAADAAAEAARLDGQRLELLPRLIDGDPAVDRELAALMPLIAARTQSAANFRDAAQLIEPAIHAAVAPTQRDAERLKVLEYELEVARYRQSLERLQAQLSELPDVIRAFHAAAGEMEAAFQRTFGQPARWAPPANQIARVLFAVIRHADRATHDAMTQRQWPFDPLNPPSLIDAIPEIAWPRSTTSVPTATAAAVDAIASGRDADGDPATGADGIFGPRR